MKGERPIQPTDIERENFAVSGEIGGEEHDASEPFRAIENEARKDALLGEIFASCTDDDPAVRAGRILDQLNAMRRELAKSGADEGYKRDRDRWLSDIANRLRELL